MSFVYLDDQFADHPKIVRAGDLAAFLWVCGLAYCKKRELQEPFIPDEQVSRLTASAARDHKKLAAKLVEVALWERVPGGYIVHDYAHWQWTREEVEARRRGLQTTRSAAGKAGAAKRWGGKASSFATANDGKGDGKPDGKPVDVSSKVHSKPMANRWQTDSPSPSPLSPLQKEIQKEPVKPPSVPVGTREPEAGEASCSRMVTAGGGRR